MTVYRFVYKHIIRDVELRVSVEAETVEAAEVLANNTLHDTVKNPYLWRADGRIG